MNLKILGDGITGGCWVDDKAIPARRITLDLNNEGLIEATIVVAFAKIDVEIDVKNCKTVVEVEMGRNET